MSLGGFIAAFLVATVAGALVVSTATGTVSSKYVEGDLPAATWTSANNVMTYNSMRLPNIANFVQVEIWQLYSSGARTRIAKDVKSVAISGSALTTRAVCKRHPFGASNYTAYGWCEWRRP